MSEKDQYAFPGDRYTKGGIKSGHGQGMSLRDYFAGQAMQGLCANNAMNDSLLINENVADWFAITSYRIADAMLEARK